MTGDTVQDAIERDPELVAIGDRLQDAVRSLWSLGVLQDAALDLVTDAVWLMTVGGDVRINRRAREILRTGKGSDTIADLAAAEFEVFDDEGREIPADDWPAVRALRGERCGRSSMRIRSKYRPKLYRVVITAAEPLYDAEGTVLGSCTVFQEPGS